MSVIHRDSKDSDSNRAKRGRPLFASFRQAVFIVALLNLAYFGIEFSVALSIKSVSLFGDSVDFLEDASINILILIGLGWSLKRRSQLGVFLAIILLIPTAATFWSAYQKFLHYSVPASTPLLLTGIGALVVNLSCARILVFYREQAGSLSRAAFLSARNDALANLGIIAAALITMFLASAWPDLIVGIAIGLLNLTAAREVFMAAQKESRT